jgi:DNA-binding CsgD family transcriptional regulator
VARNDPAPLRASIEAARAAGHDEDTARGYTNLAEVLALTGATDELTACAHEGLEFTRERGFWSHAYILEAHRCIALLRRGAWDEALAGLQALVDSVEDAGTAGLYSLPWYGRLLARRGDPAAEPLLVESWERARWQDLVVGLAYAGIAYAEWAWLVGRPELAQAVADVALERLPPHPRDELARYLARAGLPAPPPQLPAPAGDPYEQALERADVEALRTLETLRAEPAAEWLRERLRLRGVRLQRPRPETRANPAGLTARQLDVLALLGEGRTNAEIAAALHVSVRTVDHHVAAVLDKLGVRSRRDAAEAARRLNITA